MTQRHLGFDSFKGYGGRKVEVTRAGSESFLHVMNYVLTSINYTY